MNNPDHYRQYFTKEYLMGPNSFRLLEELLRRNPFETRFDRTLDLGCGMALTSVFLANETPAKSVYAFDLWVNATDNLKRIRELSLEEVIRLKNEGLAGAILGKALYTGAIDLKQAIEVCA